MASYSHISLAGEEHLDVLVVGDDSVVHHDEAVAVIGPLYKSNEDIVYTYYSKEKYFFFCVKLTCGCELMAEGTPWVAHLVWAMPTWVSWTLSKYSSSACERISSSRFFTFPFFLTRAVC